MIDFEKYDIDMVKINNYSNMCKHRFLQLESKLYKTPKRIFVYGLSGSGKDTIANHLRDNHNFTKFRLASTIKNIICETRGYEGYDELEFYKRKYPEVRKLHNKIGDILTTEAIENGINYYKTYSLNICYQLITRQHGIFETCNNIPQDYVICDIRMPEEIMFLLETNHYGIFLTRETQEFSLKGHITETNIFENGLFDDLKKSYNDKIFVINNPTTEVQKDYHKNLKSKNITDNVWNMENDASKDSLVFVLESLVSTRFQKFYNSL